MNPNNKYPQPGTGPSATGSEARPAQGLARTLVGKVLVGVAVLWLLLGGAAMLLPGHQTPSWSLLVPILYLGYYLWARGVLKVQTTVLTGIEASRENERDNDQPNS